MPNNNTILVTGGAGYIGSVVCKLLVKEGYNIIVVDDLSKGHKKALSPEAKFYQCSTLDIDAFKNVFKENKNIDAIMHFAANIEVGESVKAPDKYFYNNVVGSLNTIDMAKKYGVKGFILSSTAAVYGKPEKVPITEDSHLLPINPYGVSKLQVEQFLKYYYEAFGLKYSCLRYFNACGAYEDLGEDHNPETHLIPNIFKVTLIEKKPLNIFGSNYDTPDGTAIRDYIHVEDLATAHILALKAILDNKISNEMFNIGSSSGYSVLEVVKTSEKIAGEEILHVLAPPRVGDPPRLIAD
ncbi:MAG: UDP-glucose 4-epimerase GalE, partial [Gemmatimonadota bacterium]|nr:UDP-glucose 4-epimerase GalE [Gemmatimonadota bacterium]